MSQSVIQKGSIIYLNINKKWYCYDSALEPLGFGAMGIVYEGYSTDGAEHVAIKRVIDKYANLPNIRFRAKTEASLLFRHQNLVEMIGYCELNPGNGPIFIISKFVQGTTIDKFVNRLPSSDQRIKQICNLMYPVMDALKYIHSKNIIHMDVKPSNIMVENSNNVRLMDLGIAFVDDRIVAGESTSATLMGTPKYAAPEQFGNAASKKPLNASTDIFELGITMYELMCGNNPYQSTSIKEAVEKRKNTILPYTDLIPNKVVDVLRKATCYDQEFRYNNVNQLKRDLQNALNTQKENTITLPILIFIIVVVAISLLTLVLILLS